jgi:hypothetical protein
MKLHIDDGGRKAAGFKGAAGDCFARAVAIATGREYREVYDLINRLGGNARTGVHRKVADKVMAHLGWQWKATMQVGQGCKVHLRKDELPEGRIVTRLSRHYAAVIDGELYDTFDSRRDGKRCVYGYWYQ